MSIGNTTENAIMLLVFNATAWGNYADAAAVSPQTNIHVGLNTGDPGETGTMATTEAAYTSYARVNVARTSGGWTVTNNSVSPVANIDFPAGTGGSETLAYFTTGKTGGGAAAILWSGSISPSIAAGNGVTPRLSTSSSCTLD